MSIYRKIRKLIRNPKLFFYDSLNHKFNNNISKKNKNHIEYENKDCASYYKFPKVFNIDGDIVEDTICEKFFSYIPWINGHTESLINKINKSYPYNIKKLNLFLSTSREDRRIISEFAREKPILYKWFLRNKLAKIKDKIHGVIFTFDWAPVMRLAVDVCHELKIPSILIPHESIFLDKEKYYWDSNSFASVPTCDVALVWGELQKRIFFERGYPEERIHVVGSPKLDVCANYNPYLTREQFCHFYGFTPELPIFLFAAQYLDNQTNTKIALEAQRQAIMDVLEFCHIHKCQLLVRQPPNGSDILNRSIRSLLQDTPYASIDHSTCYQTTPEESIFHSEIVLSINSTMLFEAVIMGRKSLSMHYIEFNSIWNESLIQVAKDKIELFKLLIQMMHHDLRCCTSELDKLKYEFGIGKFDNQACHRIQHKLESIISENNFISYSHYPVSRLLNEEQLDVACIASSIDIINSVQKYLKTLLRCRTLLDNRALKHEKSLNAVQIFFQWGLLDTKNKSKLRQFARLFGCPVVYLEDGFIRSHGIGLSGEPGLSIIIDDLTPYYDATQASRLETFLASNKLVSKKIQTYCQNCIERIIKHKISKYNDAPRHKLQIGRHDRKKLLIVDQRYNDMSVTYGLANSQTFEDMLSDAINYYHDWDIIIKQHPDSIKGGKSSYFNTERLSFAKEMNNIFIIDYDINPYSLLELIDEVFVCTSQLGFEACMVEKKVHCYGMPFYAGWGITEDKLKIPRRNKKRNIFEIFYFSYIKLSRYIDPRTNELCSLEHIIDYFKQLTKEQ